MADLDGMELLKVCAVLQESVDQLFVVENILRRRADNQKGNLNPKPALAMSGSSESESRGESHTPQQHLKLQKSLLASEAACFGLVKVQRDWQFVSDVINVLLVELQNKHTFHSLFSAVDVERNKKTKHLEMINSEEEGRIRIKMLQKKLLDIQKQKAEDCERLHDMVGLLKEKIQELKVRSDREQLFVKSCAEQLVCQGFQHNQKKETELDEEIKMLQKRIGEEQDVHTETKKFLKQQQSSLQEKLQFWIRRFEKDLQEKEQKISALQNKRNYNQMRIQELSRKSREMEEVVIADRAEKDGLRAQMEKDESERKAATKVQAWWRGTIVRKGLCSPKKPGKKAKDGKKKKKK